MAKDNSYQDHLDEVDRLLSQGLVTDPARAAAHKGREKNDKSGSLAAQGRISHHEASFHKRTSAKLERARIALIEGRKSPRDFAKAGKYSKPKPGNRFGD
mgnify:CR=1 FL=1